MGDLEAHKRLVRRYYEILSGDDLGPLDEVLGQGFRAGIPGLPDGIASYRAFLSGYRSAFPNLVHTVETLVAEGNEVAALIVTAGTHLGVFLGHLPTFQSFRATGADILRIAGGKIVERRGAFDTIGMLQQLGLYAPVPAAEQTGAPQEGTSDSPPRKVPPGPGMLDIAEIRTDPLRFLADLAREHGDIVRYSAPGWQATLLNHPSYVKHVLQNNARNYTKEETPDLLMLKPMLGDGLLTSDGAAWVRQRQLLQPIFRRQEIERFGGWMAEAARDMLDGWAARPGAENAPVEMCAEMTKLTLRIVARALFGYEVAAQSDTFAHAVDALNETMGHPDPSDIDVLMRFYSGLVTVRDIVDQVVKRRREHALVDRDALSLLLAARDGEAEERLSDQEVSDQVLTLLLAGHETTAKALSWALYLLDSNPDVAARLRAEVRAATSGELPRVADLGKMPLVGAVLEETMRLYPPVWIISRMAIDDDEIDGYHIPKGSLVSLSPYLIHRHPALFPDAERFDPSRFLAGSAPDPASFVHMPFSGGPRHCVGRHFAEVEMQLVLAAIVQRFEVSLVPSHPVSAEALVTLRPRFGLPMTLRPLRDGSAVRPGGGAIP